MQLAALILNVAVLVPLMVLNLRGSFVIERAYGVQTPARGILFSIYAAITLASLGLIALHMSAAPQAASWTQALLAIQIVYKVITLPVVGPRNPVVLSNLGIAAFHALTLWVG